MSVDVSSFRGHLPIRAAVMAACLTALAPAATPAPAADGPAIGTPPRQIDGATLVNRDAVDASRYLGSSYKREADGFRMTPPAGSRMIERTGVDLVSFVVDAKSWGGSLRRVTDKAAALDEYLVNHRKEIAADVSLHGLQFLDQQSLRQGNLPAARLSFSVEVTPEVAPGKAGAPLSLLRQELIVEVIDHQFMVLTLYSPLKDTQEAKRTFDLMIPQLEIFDKATQKNRMAAVELGKSWFAQQSAEQFRAKIITQPQYFRVIVGGQDVGYFRFDELTQESNPNGGVPVDVKRDEHKGVLLTVNFRSYPNGTTVVYGQNEAFWGYSKDAKGLEIPDYSTWHNISKTKTQIPLPPAQVRPGLPAFQTVTPWLEEIGILSQAGPATNSGKRFQMNVTLGGDSTQPLLNPEQQMIPIGSANPRDVKVVAGQTPGIDQLLPLEYAPLPKIMEYSWTRFVDLTKPSEMSFIVYDSFAKKLALRNLIVTGQRESVTIDGQSQSMDCYKCFDELDPNRTTIWTDKDGHIEMMRTNDQSVMIPTTEAAMMAKWASRLKDQ